MKLSKENFFPNGERLVETKSIFSYNLELCVVGSRSISLCRFLQSLHITMEYKPLVSAPAPKPMGAMAGAIIGACVGAVLLAVVVAVDGSATTTTLYAPAATAVRPAVGGMAAMQGMPIHQVRGVSAAAPQAAAYDQMEQEAEVYSTIQAPADESNIHWAWVAVAGVFGAVSGLFLANRPHNNAGV